MAVATLRAVRDKEIVRIGFEYENSVPLQIGSLTARLFHKFTNAAGTQQSVKIGDFVLDSGKVKYTNNTGNFRAEVGICVLNPRYVDNLYVELDETYTGSIITHSANVLIGDDPTELPLPNNPVRPPEFIENEPPLPPVLPAPNNPTPAQDVIITDPVINTQLFELTNSPITVNSYSTKIVYNDDAWETISEYDSENPYIENSTENYLPDAGFNLSGIENNITVPKNWSVSGAGFIINSNLRDGPVGGTKYYEVRASNPNSFNAFSSLRFSRSQFTISGGTTNLTISWYYQIYNGENQLYTNTPPFTDWTLKTTFFNDEGWVIGNKNVQISASPADRDKWILASATIAVPTNATDISFAFETGDINTHDIFTIRIYLPQVEANMLPTSRCLTSRGMDRIYTGGSVAIKTPVSFIFEALHSAHAPIRGLFDNTQNNVNGLRLFLAYGAMHLRLINGAGIIIASADSSTIAATEGDFVNYACKIFSNRVEFYANGALLNTTAPIGPISYNSPFLIGSLNQSNTSINGKIGRVVISTITP